MKTKKMMLALFVFATGLVTLSAQGSGETHDWNNPKGTTKWFGVWLTGKVPLKPGSIKENCNMANHGGEEVRAFHIYVHPKKVEPETWNKYSFSFTPRLDGDVKISFGSNSGYAGKNKNPDLNWISIAGISAKNAKIADGTFSSSKLKDWNVTEQKDKRLTPYIVKDPKAPSGRFLKTWNGISQTIKVKKDKEVTVTFYIWPNEIIPAKW